MYTLEKRGLRLYLCYTDSLSSEPKIVKNFWPLCESNLSSWDLELYESAGAIGKRLDPCASGGYWSRELNRVIVVPEFGKLSDPNMTEVTEVPKPKRVRSEMRWENGAWRKLTKRGWELA